MKLVDDRKLQAGEIAPIFAIEKKKAIESKREVRYLQLAELRADDSSGQPKITGYAARFNSWADIGGWYAYKESIRPGAFAKTIKEADIRALWNHDPNYVLGRNRAGTLKLWEDEQGLAVEILPPDTQAANDLMVSMKRGDVNQMSFAFQVVKEEWNEETGERTLLEVRLYDVSIVTYPAYEDTSAVVRSIAPNGFDFGGLTGFFARASRGVPITSSDCDLIQSSIEILRSYAPPTAETQAADAEPSNHSTEAAGEPAVEAVHSQEPDPNEWEYLLHQRQMLLLEIESIH